MRLPILGVLALAFVGCSKPEPPVLTPKQATVASVSLTDIAFHLSVEAYNPNAIDLSAQSVTGKVTLDGKYDLGTTTIAQAVKLPAGTRTLIDVPLAMKWNDLGALASLAAANRAIPYAIDGTEKIGGERLNIELPFHMVGTLTHEDLVKVTMDSLPGLGLIPLVK